MSVVYHSLQRRAPPGIACKGGASIPKMPIESLLTRHLGLTTIGDRAVRPQARSQVHMRVPLTCSCQNATALMALVHVQFAVSLGFLLLCRPFCSSVESSMVDSLLAAFRINCEICLPFENWNWSPGSGAQVGVPQDRHLHACRCCDCWRQ